MGDVLPPVPNQPERQGLQGVVTFFKKFRWASPVPGIGPPHGARDVIEFGSIDQLWWTCILFPSVSSAYAFVSLMGVSLAPDKRSNLEFLIFMLGIVAHLLFNMVVLFSVVYWHKNDPFLLMGAKAKFMIEAIPVITAATLRTLLGFNEGHIALLLSCTMYFYIYAHFLHVAYDIGIIDVILGIAMQVLVYLPDVELLVRALAFGFCFVLCLCSYMMYSAPELPARCKKELEELPC